MYSSDYSPAKGRRPAEVKVDMPTVNRTFTSQSEPFRSDRVSENGSWDEKAAMSPYLAARLERMQAQQAGANTPTYYDAQQQYSHQGDERDYSRERYDRGRDNYHKGRKDNRGSKPAKKNSARRPFNPEVDIEIPMMYRHGLNRDVIEAQAGYLERIARQANLFIKIRLYEQGDQPCWLLPSGKKTSLLVYLTSIAGKPAPKIHPSHFENTFITDEEKNPYYANHVLVSNPYKLLSEPFISAVQKKVATQNVTYIAPVQMTDGYDRPRTELRVYQLFIEIKGKVDRLPASSIVDRNVVNNLIRSRDNNRWNPAVFGRFIMAYVAYGLEFEQKNGRGIGLNHSDLIHVAACAEEEGAFVVNFSEEFPNGFTLDEIRTFRLKTKPLVTYFCGDELITFDPKVKEDYPGRVVTKGDDENPHWRITAPKILFDGAELPGPIAYILKTCVRFFDQASDPKERKNSDGVHRHCDLKGHQRLMILHPVPSEIYSTLSPTAIALLDICANIVLTGWNPAFGLQPSTQSYDVIYEDLSAAFDFSRVYVCPGMYAMMMRIFCNIKYEKVLVASEAEKDIVVVPAPEADDW